MLGPLNEADLMNIVCSDIYNPSRVGRRRSSDRRTRAAARDHAGKSISKRRGSDRDQKRDSEGRVTWASSRRRSSDRERKESGESGVRRGSGKDQSQDVKIRHYIEGIESSFLSPGHQRRRSCSPKVLRAVLGLQPNDTEHHHPDHGHRHRRGSIMKTPKIALPVVTFSPSPAGPFYNDQQFLTPPPPNTGLQRRGSLFVRTASEPDVVMQRVERSRSIGPGDECIKANKAMLLRLFRESSRSAESGYKKRGLRSRYRTDDEAVDYVSPLLRFRKIARMVQLALIFYSGEGRTRGRNHDDENEAEKFFSKSDQTKMTFLPEFDPSLYKAQRIKELVVGSDIKEILSKRPEDRTEEEIQQVLFALRTYQTFAEYPLNMQERMCRKAHYLKFDANRIILRQGDRAEWFYYVLSGTTAVSILEENKKTGHVNLRNVGYLTRGTAFGELALLHGSRRTATVSCKDAVELIAVDKEDFVQMNQLDTDEEKEHIKYCRSLPILSDWPVSLLSEVSGICNFHFFKKGTVMAKSNHSTPFIYIVKSGRVKVLTKVTKLRKKRQQGCRLPHYRSRTPSSKSSGGRSVKSDPCSPRDLNSNGGGTAGSTGRPSIVSNSHGSSRHLRGGNLVPLISRLNVGAETGYTDVAIQPTFLQVCLLGSGDSFGLSTLVYPEEISCGIVSMGAECIEISKEFFIKHASENYLRKLKALIRPFPSEEKLQEDMRDQKEWCNYKNSIISEVLDSSSI